MRTYFQSHNDARSRYDILLLVDVAHATVAVTVAAQLTVGGHLAIDGIDKGLLPALHHCMLQGAVLVQLQFVKQLVQHRVVGNAVCLIYHTAARQVVQMGSFPDTLEGIKSLKGVGDYTAAAIASIAFGLPAAVVDGNVYRVLARYFGIETPVGTTAAKKEFTALAQSLLPANRPGECKEGMMDFGAMVCTPASPDCAHCPLSETCFAHRSDRVEALPVKKEPVTVKERFLTYIYIRNRGRIAMHKRPAGDIWQGLWEPFLLEAPASQTQSAARDARPLLPSWAAGAKLLREKVRHQLTHRTLYADFYLLETDIRPPLPDDYRWLKETELDRYAKPRLFELLLESVEKR